MFWKKNIFLMTLATLLACAPASESQSTLESTDVQNRQNKQQKLEEDKSHPKISQVKSMKGAQVAPGFKAAVFAKPPEITYPTGLSASPEGDVYVSVDLNSSLGRKANYGKIVKCRDTNHDGVADTFTDFVKNVDSPRGSCFVGDTLYVVHPPYLSAFKDTTGDGVADKKDVLIKGLGFDLSFRGADHTSNGVRMGIDGWLYLAIGDYGMVKAEAKDSSTVHLHGGGVLRVRPDGSELEIHTLYTRNIVDVAVTPMLDVFSRDNTNDGKGWNTRFHHLIALADMGYPRLYKNFADEHLAALADYGGGSGTGALHIDEPGFPKEYNDKVYSGDFTTQKVYVHPMKSHESTFTTDQKEFYSIKAIDMDVDGFSRIYICDWKGGSYHYRRKDVGSVSLITYPQGQSAVYPNIKKLSDADLLKHIVSASAVCRINTQREILKRGEKDIFVSGLKKLAQDKKQILYGRIAALFTLKQLSGVKSHDALMALAQDDTLREFAIRALADRVKQCEAKTAALFVKGLQDKNDRVALQSVIALARLGDKQYAKHILPLTQSTRTTKPLAIPHVSERALVALQAEDTCLNELKGRATYQRGALRALMRMHRPSVVSGLIKAFEQGKDSKIKVGIMTALFRLYHKDKRWQPKSSKDWWGTRPDDRGPYFNPVIWEQSATIKTFIEKYFSTFSKPNQVALFSELRRNRIDPLSLKLNSSINFSLALLESPSLKETHIKAVIDIAKSPKQILSNRLKAFDVIGRIRSKRSFYAQLELLEYWDKKEKNNAAFQQKKLDFIYSSDRVNQLNDMERSLRKPRGHQGDMLMMMALNLKHSPLIMSQEDGVKIKARLDKIIKKHELHISFIRAVAFLGLTEYETQIKKAASNEDVKLKKEAQLALKKLEAIKKSSGKKIATLKASEAMALTLKTKGDVTLGEKLFSRQACIACHAVSKTQMQKGPYLGDVGNKFDRRYLIEAILSPSAIVSQGFQSQWFKMKNGQQHDGFVTSAADGVIELRSIAGTVTKIKKDDIKERGSRKESMMPEGLASGLSVEELASLVDYMQSLKDKK